MVALAQMEVTDRAISLVVQCSVYTVRKWCLRAETTGDLNDLPRSGRPSIYGEQTQLRVIAFYCQTKPFETAGQWSLRVAEQHLKAHPQIVEASPSKSTLQRILQNNRLKPHLSRYFLHITDPDFFPKLEHLLALYANPPRLLFFFDECPGIQILKRLVPDLRTDSTKEKLKEFEYIRNGTMDVFAFLSRHEGTVSIECHGDHTTDTFLGVFERHASQFPPTEPLHYVMDNLSSHQSYLFCQLVAKLCGIDCPSEKQLNTAAKRAAWLRRDDKRIVIHFTPFHGSWLNQVEIWFGIMGQKVLGDSYGSPDDLLAAVFAFEYQWNELLAHPFKWSYDGHDLHNKAVSRFAAMLDYQNETPELRTLTKLMKLTKNLLNDYFSQVPTKTWNHFVTAFLKKREPITVLIEKEKGPIRKRKAQDAFVSLNSTIHHRLPQITKALAA